MDFAAHLEDATHTMSRTSVVFTVVGSTKQQILRQNPSRLYVQLCNNGAAPIDIAWGSSASSSGNPTIGIRLIQNQFIDYKIKDIGSMIFDELWATHNFAANWNVTIQECIYVSARRGNRPEDVVEDRGVHGRRGDLQRTWRELKEKINRVSPATRRNRNI